MKILVTVGTQKQEFSRIFEYVEKYLSEGNEVVMQTGHCKYNGTFEFTDKMDEYVDWCDVLVAHGGAGTLVNAMLKDKVIISVPRLAKYGEHVNDHQTELLTKLDREGYLMMCPTEEDFKQAVSKLGEFVPTKYESNNEYFNLKINELISEF